MAFNDARPSGFTALASTADWESLWSAAGAHDGIFNYTNNAFKPTLPGGNVIQIEAGVCMIKGQLWSSDTAYQLPIPAPSAQNRYDVIVLRFDRNSVDSAHVVQPILIQGTPAASPTPPPIQQTATGFWDVPVAQWRVQSSGIIDSLLDRRQFSGFTVMNILSTARPIPPYRCIALEVDTGNLMQWNGSAWVIAYAPQPKLSHWTFTGASPTTGVTSLPGAAQNVTITVQSTLVVSASMDVAMPSNAGILYTVFARLNNVDIEGNSFIVMQAPSARLTLSRSWVTGVLQPGTYAINIVHQVTSVAAPVQNRGGDVTVLAVPS